MDKKKEERLLMKPKLTIGMNENKISIFTKYMKHCFMGAFKPKRCILHPYIWMKCDNIIQFCMLDKCVVELVG
jgi:hypothetical protein